MASNSTYDLEERTTAFAVKVVQLCKLAQRNPMNDRIIGQLVGSSGSVGANYREANDALGKKDFICRLKISRKEAKETIHWLVIFKEANLELTEKIIICLKEAIELKNILSAILVKAESPSKK